MKSAFFALAFVALPASALAAPTAPAVIANCSMQAGEIASNINDYFKALPDDLRAQIVDNFALDLSSSADAACVKNYLDFATGAKAVLTQENVKQGLAFSSVNNLLNQANEQYARFSPLSANVLVSSYRALTQSASRFRVIDAWGKKVAEQTDVNMAKRLREFFQTAREVSVAAGDEEYVARLASQYETSATQKVIELGSNGSFQFPVPVTNMNQALNDYRAGTVADRFLLVQYLARTYAANPTDDAYIRAAQTRNLVSLLDFSRRIVEILKANEANETFTIQANTAFTNGLVEMLARRDDVTAADMRGYYSQLQGASSRYAVITYWRDKVAGITAVPMLDKLVVFFGQAQQASEQLNDDAYIRKEAGDSVLRAQKRIIELSNAPAFAVPIVDQNKALSDFTAMALPQRFLVVKKLSDDYAASTDARALVSIYTFAKAVKPVLAQAGDTQAFILQQADALLVQTVELLARSATLSADDLVNYYKELRGEAARFDVIQYWGKQIDLTNTQSGLTRLRDFFKKAGLASIILRDGAHVPREAKSNETKASQKLATL